MSEGLSNILKFISSKHFYGPIITILGAIIVYNVMCLIFNKIIVTGKTEHEIKKRKTIVQLFQNILRYGLLIIVILVILEIFGVDTKTLIAGFGILGLVIGLALQDTLKDLIVGITIIMDDYYVVGDTIEYKGFKGEVISLGLRSTKIKKYTGEVQTFANRNVDLVINYSQKNSHQLFEILTEYDIPIKDVEDLLKKLNKKLESIENVIKNETNYLGVSEITSTNVKHLLALKCKRMTQYQVRRDVIALLKDEFDKKKIKIAIS